MRVALPGGATYCVQESILYVSRHVPLPGTLGVAMGVQALVVVVVVVVSKEEVIVEVEVVLDDELVLRTAEDVVVLVGKVYIPVLEVGDSVDDTVVQVRDEVLIAVLVLLLTLDTMLLLAPRVEVQPLLRNVVEFVVEFVVELVVELVVDDEVLVP